MITKIFLEKNLDPRTYKPDTRQDMHSTMKTTSTSTDKQLSHQQQQQQQQQQHSSSSRRLYQNE